MRVAEQLSLWALSHHVCNHVPGLDCAKLAAALSGMGTLRACEGPDNLCLSHSDWGPCVP